MSRVQAITLGLLLAACSSKKVDWNALEKKIVENVKEKGEDIDQMGHSKYSYKVQEYTEGDIHYFAAVQTATGFGKLKPNLTFESAEPVDNKYEFTCLEKILGADIGRVVTFDRYYANFTSPASLRFSPKDVDNPKIQPLNNEQFRKFAL